MRMSDAGKKHLMDFEGVIRRVYDDLAGSAEKRRGIVSCYDPSIVGTPTIGVGHVVYHTGSWHRDECDRFKEFFRDGRDMTDKEVMDLLSEDLPKYENYVNRDLKVGISQKQYDALVHMVFNTGPNASAFKKALQLTNEKKFAEAAEAIRNGPQKSKGKLLQGLVRRRNFEADLYLEGANQNPLIAMISSGPLSKPAFWITLLAVGGIGTWAYFNWDFVKEKLELE